MRSRAISADLWKPFRSCAKLDKMAVSATETREDRTIQATDETSNTSPPVEEKSKPNADESPLEKTTSRIENYPTGIKLALILLSIYLSVLLVALDRTIIATALPKITDHFKSFDDVGWVGQLL